MSKTIKVDDEVYQRLNGLIVHRETFNMVIVRLLKVYDALYKVSNLLGAGNYWKQGQNLKEEEQK